MGWRTVGGSMRFPRGRRAAVAAAVAGLALVVAVGLGSAGSLASRGFEWMPTWGSFYSFELGDRRQITDYAHGSLSVPLRAGQDVHVRWEATAVTGGTVEVVLVGPETDCRAEIAGPGFGVIVFRVAEPGFHRLDMRGSATSRTADGHRFTATPPPGYELVYRAKWGPVSDARRRTFAARAPDESYREVACPARGADASAPRPPG